MTSRMLHPRGVTMLELIIAQTIVLIIMSGLLSLMTGLTKTLHSQTSASDAQVRLREATYILLRDLQGLGGEERANAVDLFFVTDGGATNGDKISLFKRDTAICGGSLTVSGTATLASTTIAVNAPATTCPFTDLGTTCSPSLLYPTGKPRRVALRGPTNRTIVLTMAAAPTSSNCRMTFLSDSAALSRYQTLYPAIAVTTLDQAIAQLGTPITVIPGNGIDYQLGTEPDPVNAALTVPTLDRRVNNDTTGYKTILDYVYDIQFMRGFDLNSDGILQENEYENSPTWVVPTTAPTAEQFIGMKIGIVTYGKSKDGIDNLPPAQLSNRSLTGAPTGRKYRASVVFAAARNP